MNSDHGEVEEDDLKTKLSMDSTKPSTTKRHIDSEDEQDIPAKKRRCSPSKEFETPEKNDTEVISDKNDIDKNDIKEKKDAVSSESKSDLDENSLDINVKKENEEDQEDKLTKDKNEAQNISKDENNLSVDENTAKIKEEITSENSPSKGPDSAKTASTSDNEKTEEDNIVVDDIDDCKENNKGNGMREKHTKSRITDTEVVDGLELSVECASDKEGSSSDSADEEEKKPRPKTVIVKAEPNASELECGSSDDEKSDAQETNDAVETKSKKRGKRRSTRTSFSKLKASGSEDSQNNNSDEDYSPRTKKKLKRSPGAKKSAKRSTESKRGRGGGAKRNAHKRNTEGASDDENSDIISVDKTDKTTKKDEAEEELSGKESSMSKSDDKSNSDNEEKSTKSRRSRRSSTKPEDSKQIQSLKKYIRTAGVKVKSYQEIWAGCRNNTERANRLKDLLEKKGVIGKPTLEKCKQAKKRNEKIQEISELDTSNIISEGRITRARRNMEGNKKSTIVETPTRHREARNTLKRLRTVVDSDSD